MKIKKNKKKKFENYTMYRKFKKLIALKKKTPKLVNHLHLNKKLKQGIFLKKPCFNEIKYPFYLNLKLIQEYIKKN
jgi:hypothetical protein